MRYNYHVSCFAAFDVDIEADTPEEAYEKGRKLYESADMGYDGFEFVEEIEDNLYNDDYMDVKPKNQ